ncbi:hypothetical protein G6553_12405 [Nocardioides sp. IC4_145]|uniref:hypothetical protein n=1 Tax=Nocardioides sp. IC4_145 TaxID=2714037 RepID=UPI00140B7A45|nr:hypothetical protein [Nocardioides sp. IC4_145]NHC23972.1 hypothetical protein [Nocardioides sp. IC4_145]
MVRSTDTWRRAVSLVLVVLCFLAVPQVAQAVFNGQVKPGGTAVAAARMAPVTAISGSITCDSRFLDKSTATVAITGVTDAGQLDVPVTYSVEVSRNGTSSARLNGKTGSVYIEQSYALARMTFDVRITATYRSWSTSFEREATCPAFNVGTNRL